MKSLSLKESKEFELLEAAQRIKSANKTAAQDLILQMIASLPRTQLSSQISMAEVKAQYYPQGKKTK